jgi:hypothetical protein
MREIELKKEEEEIKQCEEALKKAGGRIEDMGGIIGEAQKETCYFILFYAVGSRLCIVIPFSMCYNSNLFYVSCF